jgi:hypothetical protein
MVRPMSCPVGTGVIPPQGVSNGTGARACGASCTRKARRASGAGRAISASSPLVGFGELNDNTIKGLTSLLSVEQEIEFIAYTCRLWNEKCI